MKVQLRGNRSLESRDRRRFSVEATVVLGFALFFVFAVALGAEAAATLTVLYGFIGGLLHWGRESERANRDTQAAELTIAGGQLAVHGSRRDMVLPLSRLENAWSYVEDGVTWVRLMNDAGVPTEVGTRKPAEARDLLRRLGFGDRWRLRCFRTGYGRTVEVGVDGVRSVGLEGDGWYVPLRAIDEIEARGGYLHVYTDRDQRSATVPDPHQLAALARCIQARIDAERPQLSVPGFGGVVREWRAQVESLTTGYRRAGERVETLRRVLKSPAASETERLGAALMLRVADGREASRRVARIARATVNPKLRVALEAVGAGDEDSELNAAVEDALSEVEA